MYREPRCFHFAQVVIALTLFIHAVLITADVPSACTVTTRGFALTAVRVATPALLSVLSAKVFVTLALFSTAVFAAARLGDWKIWQGKSAQFRRQA